MMQAISFYSLKLKRKIMVNAQDITLVHLPNGRPVLGLPLSMKAIHIDCISY